MGERPHGVVGVRSAARSVGNGKPRLLVIGIGMANRNNQAVFACRFQARSRTKHLRGNGDEPRVSPRCLQKAFAQALRRRLDPFDRMYASPYVADERPLNGEPQSFSTGLLCPVL